MTLEDRHAAFLAGIEYGLAHRFKAEVADAVHAALHDQALGALDMARRYAKRKGPAWAAMIQECGESDE
jgi:stage V sporulation protein SpoVS